MAYTTKNIKLDAGSKPIPQTFNPTADDFQQLTGVDLGSSRYGMDSLAWGKTAGGVYVPLCVDTDGQLQVDVLTIPNVTIGAALPAGTALMGKVGIDQTTDGTTNKVAATQSAHDNLNANANLQVNNADNAVGNPAFVVPTSDYPSGAVPWAITDDSSANAAKNLTKTAGGVGKYHYITAVEVVISGAAAGADITCVLKDDAAGTPTSYWKEVIGNAAPRGARVGIAFTKPIKLGANKTADLVVSIGGASCVTSLSMAGYTL